MTTDCTESNATELTEVESRDGAPGKVARESNRLSPASWRVASLALLLEASFLRLFDPGLKPLHHDEGVNGSFLTQLFRTGEYFYNPENYHGPTLYYGGLVSSYIVGLNTTAIRLVPALFGIGIVWLLLGLRRWIGDLAALLAAAFIAVSPGAVFFSRYFIHETLFVFFTLCFVVYAMRYGEGKKPTDLYLASISAALLFATKETSVISFAVLAIAAALAKAYLKFFRAGSDNDELSIDPQASLSDRRTAFTWTVAVVLFLLVSILFYSSFFTNPQGPLDSLRTFRYWTKTGTGHLLYPWYQYAIWLAKEEAGLVVTGLAGAVLLLITSRKRFEIIFALWAVGICSAYSLVPYKTPWLALSFLIPLAITASCGIRDLIERWRRPLVRGLIGLVATAAIMIGLVQAISINFFHYDDDTYPYVFAHTRREFLGLISDVHSLSEQVGTGRDTTIAVTSPDYWPLPWYLRNYSHVGYYGKVFNATDSLVIGSELQQVDLANTLGSDYRRVGSYTLRPGINLVLYARQQRTEEGR